MIKVDDELFDLLRTKGYTDKDSNLLDVVDWLYHKFRIIVNVYPEYSKSYEMFEYRVKIYVENIDEVEEHFIKRSWYERPCDGLREGIITSLKYIK